MPSTLPGAERAPPERGSVSLGVTCMLSRVAWMQPWHPPRHSPNQTRVRIELLNTDPEAAHQNHLGRRSFSTALQSEGLGLRASNQYILKIPKWLYVQLGEHCTRPFNKTKQTKNEATDNIWQLSTCRHSRWTMKTGPVGKLISTSWLEFYYSVMGTSVKVKHSVRTYGGRTGKQGGQHDKWWG